MRGLWRMALASEEEPPNPSIRAPQRAPPIPLPISIETAPAQLESDGGEGPVSPPISLREIRARPLDVDKDLPLLFVEDDVLADDLATSPAVPPTPVARPDSSGALPISVPQYAPASYGNISCTSGMHTRRFRRPTHMIRQQSTAAEVKVEYEMDEEDEAWLTNLNSRVHMRMLDCNRFEEMVDALERASFNAMHSQAASRADGGRQPARQTSVHVPAVQAPERNKSPKLPTSPRDKAGKPEKPRPPADEDLRELPAGLCRRFQQGRCHKGRSCKWRHEIWEALQQRSERSEQTGRTGMQGAPAALATDAPVHAEDASAASLFLPSACSCGNVEKTAASAAGPLSTSTRIEIARASDIAHGKRQSEEDTLLATGQGMQHGCSAQPLSNGPSQGEAATSSADANADCSDFGVTLAQAKELLRGPAHVLSEVWHHWKSKRRRDSQKLPILSSLRRDAEQMNARMAQFAESQSAMEGVISQLERARTLLELIKRREKLKRQIVAVEQATFEACVKHGVAPSTRGRRSAQPRVALPASTAQQVNERPPRGRSTRGRGSRGARGAARSARGSRATRKPTTKRPASTSVFAGVDMQATGRAADSSWANSLMADVMADARQLCADDDLLSVPTDGTHLAHRPAGCSQSLFCESYLDAVEPARLKRASGAECSQQGRSVRARSSRSPAGMAG